MSDHSDNHQEPLSKPEVWLNKISKQPTIQRYASTAKSVLKFFIWGVVEDENDPQFDISSIRTTNKTSRDIVSTQPYRSSYDTDIDSQVHPRIQPIKTATNPEKDANKDRDNADSSVKGHPIKAYNKYIPQPLIKSDKYNTTTLPTKTKLLRPGGAQRLPTSSTPLYPAQPAPEIQRYLILLLIKYIIWRVLETNKHYNKSQNKNRVTDEARPD